jgi:hypothetical protein
VTWAWVTRWTTAIMGMLLLPFFCTEQDSRVAAGLPG